MSRLVTPAPPINADLGTVWRSDDAGPQDGPLAAELGPLAEGLVRVQKQCRRCGRDFDGWMFLAHYRKRTVKTPYHVGPYRACDDCVGTDQRATQIADLDRKIDLARQRWDGARVLTKKIPAGRALRHLLEQLVALLAFGSERFEKASNQLDVVGAWVDERQTAESTL